MRIFYVGGFEIYDSFEDEARLASMGVDDRLISFAFIKQREVYGKTFEKVNEYGIYKGTMLDCGAFTAAFRGDHIGLEEYIDFCKTQNYDFMVGLDEIPLDKENGFSVSLCEQSARVTKENCDRMKAEGLSIIPTFHQGEDYDYLRYYCDNFHMVALGIASKRKAELSLQLRHLDSCFDIIPEYVAVHGLAITDLTLPLLYPFYSVDSNTWQREARYGKIKIKLFGEYKTLGLTRGLSHRKLTDNKYLDLYGEEYYITTSSVSTRHYDLTSKEVREECDKYLESIGTNVDKCREDLWERYRVNIIYYNELLRSKIKIPQRQEVLF